MDIMVQLSEHRIRAVTGRIPQLSGLHFPNEIVHESIAHAGACETAI